MRITRYPNGFVELADGVVTVGGGETITIAVSDLRRATAREGKKSWFSRNPPAVLELEYAAGLDVVRSKLMIPVEELERARELVARLGKG